MNRTQIVLLLIVFHLTRSVSYYQVSLIFTGTESFGNGSVIVLDDDGDEDCTSFVGKFKVGPNGREYIS